MWSFRSANKKFLRAAPGKRLTCDADPNDSDTIFQVGGWSGCVLCIVRHAGADGHLFSLSPLQIFSCAERKKKIKPGTDYELGGSLRSVEVDFAKK